MQHQSLKEKAYDIIRGKILNGEFAPGVRIREDLLAEEISMSRTPVREAINQLSAEGLVNSIPRKGIYSLNMDGGQILNLLDVRETLEVLAIRRCIENISQEKEDRLERLLKEFKEALSESRYERCNELDSCFHSMIAEITGNGKLIEYLSEIEDFMQIARAVEKKTEPETKNRLTLSEHTAILQCIKDRDSEGAERAVRENINRMRKNLGISRRFGNE